MLLMILIIVDDVYAFDDFDGIMMLMIFDDVDDF